jgi:hypothetical protein
MHQSSAPVTSTVPFRPKVRGVGDTTICSSLFLFICGAQGRFWATFCSRGQQELKPHVLARGDLRTLSANVCDLDARKLAFERHELVVVPAHGRERRGGPAERDVRMAPDRDRDTHKRRGRRAQSLSALTQVGRAQLG